MSSEIKCPFCGETIKSDARKCRFCGEFLEEGVTRSGILAEHAANKEAAPAAPATPAAPPAETTPPAAAPAPAAPAAPTESAPAATPAAETAPAEPAAEAIPANLLAGLYEQLGQLPDSDEKTKLLETLKALEGKTDEDNESDVEGMLKTVTEILPDVAEITINTLINPASGVTTIVQKVAQRLAASKGK